MLQTYLLLASQRAEEAYAVPLHLIRQRALSHDEGIQVLFEPSGANRALTECANRGAQIAWRVLAGENKLRHRWRLTYAAPGQAEGRSAELLFALHQIVCAYAQGAAAPSFPTFAATGALLDEDGTVGAVHKVPAKVAAARDALAGQSGSLVFVPQANVGELPQSWLGDDQCPRVVPVASVTEALTTLGLELQLSYLGCPFRGLEHFGFEHRALFFGREGEVQACLDQLARQAHLGRPGLLVSGPSGSGKSSFVQAGVLAALLAPRLDQTGNERKLPAFARSLKDHIWRPGQVTAAGEAGLAKSLMQAWAKVIPDLAGLEAHNLQEATQYILARLPQDYPLVWVIDQFEELFTGQTYAPESLRVFGDLLLNLQQSGVWVLATLRDDFLAHFRRVDILLQWHEQLSRDFYLKPLSDAASLTAAIRRPAAMAGLDFEADAHGWPLDGELVKEALGAADPMPLVQYTLLELFERRRNRVLSWKAFGDLGGLHGAIGKRAEAVYAELSAKAQAATPAILLNLCTADRADSRRIVARRASLDTLNEEAAQALIQARLLTSNGQIVRVAHEALFTHWPRAQAWLDDAQWARLVLRQRLENDADRWRAAANDAERTSLLLSPGRPLREGQRLLADWPSLLNPTVTDFIKASLRNQRRRQGTFLTAATVILIVLSLLGGWYLYQDRIEATQLAEAEKTAKYAEEKRAAAEKAAAALGTRERYESIVTELANELDTKPMTVNAAKKALIYLAHLPKYAGQASLDRIVNYYERVRTLKRLATTQSLLLPERVSKTSVASGVLVAAGDSGALYAVDAASGKRLGNSPPLQNSDALPVRKIFLSANGKYVASIDSIGMITLWKIDRNFKKLASIDAREVVFGQLLHEGKTSWIHYGQVSSIGDRVSIVSRSEAFEWQISASGEVNQIARKLKDSAIDVGETSYYVKKPDITAKYPEIDCIRDEKKKVENLIIDIIRRSDQRTLKRLPYTVRASHCEFIGSMYPDVRVKESPTGSRLLIHAHGEYSLYDTKGWKKLATTSYEGEFIGFKDDDTLVFLDREGEKGFRESVRTTFVRSDGKQQYEQILDQSYVETFFDAASGVLYAATNEGILARFKKPPEQKPALSKYIYPTGSVEMALAEREGTRFAFIGHENFDFRTRPVYEVIPSTILSESRTIAGLGPHTRVLAFANGKFCALYGRSWIGVEDLISGHGYMLNRNGQRIQNISDHRDLQAITEDCVTYLVQSNVLEDLWKYIDTRSGDSFTLPEGRQPLSGAVAGKILLSRKGVNGTSLLGIFNVEKKEELTTDLPDEGTWDISAAGNVAVSFNEQRRLIAVSILNGKVLSVSERPVDDARFVAISGNEREVAVVTGSGLLHLFDLPTGKALGSPKFLGPAEVTAIAFTGMDKFVSTVFADGSGEDRISVTGLATFFCAVAQTYPTSIEFRRLGLDEPSRALTCN